MKSDVRKLPLYLNLAQNLELQIRQGTFRLGDPVPSVRELSRQHRVSISTALQAYLWLENRGWIEARPRSGFYVRRPLEQASPEPAYRSSTPRPTTINVGQLVIEVITGAGQPETIQFGAACPSPELMPNRQLSAIIRRISRQNPAHSSHYSVPPGELALRQQIARRSLYLGCNILPQDIVITCGAMEALNLCLRATAQPGNVVATESPTYFGVLQTIESLGMKAVEIATHPRTGMDLNLLEHAIQKHRVKTCIAMPTCHNPLGYVVPDKTKRAMIDLLGRYNVPLIEDDVYGDLAFESPRPRAAKSFDRNGMVLYCGSFSKTIGPGLRTGWVQAGRFQPEVERIKLITTIASPSLQQFALAEFLGSGGYDRHVRNLRVIFEEQVFLVQQAISKCFPQGTSVSRPEGGYVLWLGLPSGTDAVGVYRTALENGIGISPGPIFSASGKFTNYVRINCGRRWSEQIDRALLKLGKICSEAAKPGK